MQIYSECELLPSFLRYSVKRYSNYEKDDSLQETIKSMESVKSDSNEISSTMTMIMLSKIITWKQLASFNFFLTVEEVECCNKA